MAGEERGPVSSSRERPDEYSLTNPPWWFGKPLFWLAMAGLLVTFDYLSGPFIRFPVMFLIPILGLTLFVNRRWGYATAVLLPVMRLAIVRIYWNEQYGWFENVVNFCIYVFVFLLMVELMDRIREQAREIRTLREILPVCSFCRRIRAEDGSWHPFEQYLTDHVETKISHGLCRECMEKHYGQFLKDKDGRG